MLLAIDVGNSETKLGFFPSAEDEGRLAARTWRVTTARRRTSDEFGVLFAALFRRAEIPLEAVRAIVVSSVVPQNDRALSVACRDYYGLTPAFFTAASQNLLEIHTERPAELGSDLVAAAIGAKARLGSPVIVVAFGTATVFGVVGTGGAYLGAAIAPGIQISIDALVARTAKLRQVALETPPAAIGRETVASLQSGIVYGFVGQTEGLVARLRAEIGAPAPVIATGGFAGLIAKHTAIIEAVEPYLVLDGLRRFYVAGGAGIPGLP
jgi:type III pantothenate kinase